VTAKRGDMVVHREQPYNAETSVRALRNGDVTALDAFYVRNHGPVPELDRERWRVRVGGLVDRPLELSVAELRERFEPRELTVTLQCAGNRRAGLIAVKDIPGEAPWGGGATGTATWRGVALADVLRAAGIRPGAAHIELIGAETCPEATPPQRFGGSIPLTKALGGEVLLAWTMNRRPLPAVHGAPVRAIVPGYIGARSVKWLQWIIARADESDNYFQACSYRLFPPGSDSEGGPVGASVALGALAVNADILVPEDGDTVAAGEIEVSGYALTGDGRTVVRVDVSSDHGRHWRQAELLEYASVWSWRRWRTTMTVLPGEVEIVARAWDSAAATQPEDPAHLWNPKGYVNNSWARVVLHVAPHKPK
jgi:sulfite oxidase